MRSVKSLQCRIVKAVKAGQWRKSKAIQRILSKSYAAKLLAIRRTTENSGKRTAGIDGQKWDTPIAKYEAIAQLQLKGYKPLAVRRIKIPKKNGKFRPTHPFRVSHLKVSQTFTLRDRSRIHYAGSSHASHTLTNARPNIRSNR